MVSGIGLIYYFAPDAEQDWACITPGSLVAAYCWLLGSLAFRYYVVNFGSYQGTYGTVTGVMLLLLRFYLTGLVVIIGAEISAEIEHASEWGKAPGEKMPGKKSSGLPQRASSRNAAVRRRPDHRRLRWKRRMLRVASTIIFRTTGDTSTALYGLAAAIELAFTSRLSHFPLFLSRFVIEDVTAHPVKTPVALRCLEIRHEVVTRVQLSQVRHCDHSTVLPSARNWKTGCRGIRETKNPEGSPDPGLSESLPSRVCIPAGDCG